MAMFKALSLTILCIMPAGCSDTCGDDVVLRLTSPDGQRDAVMFQRDCSATTGFSTQISILNAGEELSGMGNTFRADDEHGAARSGSWGGPWAEMKWLSPDRLLIRYTAKSRLFEQDDHVSGVGVTYEVVGS